MLPASSLVLARVRESGKVREKHPCQAHPANFGIPLSGHYLDASPCPGASTQLKDDDGTHPSSAEPRHWPERARPKHARTRQHARSPRSGRASTSSTRSTSSSPCIPTTARASPPRPLHARQTPRPAPAPSPSSSSLYCRTPRHSHWMRSSDPVTLWPRQLHVEHRQDTS
jgi:hypothetical protein